MGWDGMVILYCCDTKSIARAMLKVKTNVLFEYHLPSSVDEERADDDVADADDEGDDTQG